MSNMTPFEIRLELLKMAQTMLEQDYYGKREQISNDWQVKVENARHAGSAPPEHPGFPAYPTEAEVVVERSFFKDFYFDVSTIVDTVYQYEPKVYPYHELKSVASDDVLRTIKTLESFPEANNKPIFDHFGVIVPSIAYKHKMFKGVSGILQD